jgi:hypothetical protein
LLRIKAVFLLFQASQASGSGNSVPLADLPRLPAQHIVPVLQVLSLLKQHFAAGICPSEVVVVVVVVVVRRGEMPDEAELPEEELLEPPESEPLEESESA